MKTRTAKLLQRLLTCSLIGAAIGCANQSRVTGTAAAASLETLSATPLYTSYQQTLAAWTAAEKSRFLGNLQETPTAAYVADAMASAADFAFEIDHLHFAKAQHDLPSNRESGAALAAKFSTLGALWDAAHANPLTTTLMDFQAGLSAVYEFDQGRGVDGLNLIGASTTGRILEGMKNISLICTTVTGTLTGMIQMGKSINKAVNDGIIVAKQTELELKRADLELKALEAKSLKCTEAEAASIAD